MDGPYLPRYLLPRTYFQPVRAAVELRRKVGLASKANLANLLDRLLAAGNRQN